MAREMDIKSPGRQYAARRDVIVPGQDDLLEAVGAEDAPGSLACGMEGRQQERDQYRDDGDHDRQLDPVNPLPMRTPFAGKLNLFGLDDFNLLGIFNTDANLVILLNHFSGYADLLVLEMLGGVSDSGFAELVSVVVADHD
jgi:hypothetical protein